MLNYTEVALTWRALGHGQARPDDVVAIIRQFHRDSLLTVLIRLNLALTHQRGRMLSDLMFPDESDAGRRAVIFSTMTRGEVFRHDEAYLPNTISRCYDLFVGLPPIVKSAGPLRDLRALFRQATGMEFEDYLGLAFGVLAYYDNLDPQNIGNGSSPIRAG